VKKRTFQGVKTRFLQDLSVCLGAY